MNLPPRRVAPPVSLKRKEIDSHFRPQQPVLTKSLKPPPPRLRAAEASKSAFPPPTKQARLSHDSAPQPKPASAPQSAKSACNGLLLAGYMAHEYLTKGTIMGEKLDPVRAAAVPPGRSSRSDQPRREAEDRYAEVASLLKTDGANIPGIVNPTQLARFLNL